MLVLTRRRGEEVVIGQNIRLTVVRVEGAKVRLGIDAPVSVRVRRQESFAEKSLDLARATSAATATIARQKV